MRLQAAAPGVPVVPLPLLMAETAHPGGWWPMRARRAADRSEVVSLLQQRALLDEGARQLFYLATHDRLTGLANRWLSRSALRTRSPAAGAATVAARCCSSISTTSS